MTTIERDPALVWNPLTEHASQPEIVPYQWIVHTAVDAPGPTDLHAYFEHHSDLESHTWLRWASHEQLMDLDRRADANYHANRFRLPDGRYVGAISTETEDDGHPEEKPWNGYQIKELIRFGVWLHRTFGIPVELPKAWDAPGMGYHCLYPNDWTNVPGKTCPGHTRTKQFIEVVLPGIRAAIAPPTNPPSEEDDDMPKPMLLRLDAKDAAVLYMSTARTIHWIRDRQALEGYKLDMQMNGLSPDVCVLSNIVDDTTADKKHLDELNDFVCNLPYIGDMAPGHKALWKGPHIASTP